MEYNNITDIDEADPQFLRQLALEPGSSDLSKCFQCGVCTASCPVKEIDEKFSPRRVMKLAKLGLKNKLFKSEEIWLCSLCFICQERCPQNVRPPEVMTVLRNLAAAERVAPPQLQKLLEVLAKFGRVYKIDDFIMDERAERGLPVVKVEFEFIKKILED
ncbi:4Fe-4S dicluster domain-containing protein [Candidatus Bathyarchaeota archaeon]|nr:4Fe-4S dicluster domain-containing protein [Candidatus Bathyarchaeota archaeon]MBS7630410.1 4Fe-4S dicluster domain-containing protein [Candidatus Bathyarchaeota archaeon]